MGIIIAIEAQGLAFHHGSETGTGYASYLELSNLFYYFTYQAIVENLGLNNNSVIHDLSNTTR